MDTVYLLLIGLILIGSVGFNIYRSRRRTESVKAIAPPLGLEFLGEGNALIPPVVWNFSLFSKGRLRRVRNVLSREEEDIQIFLFDYSYTMNSSKRKKTHRYTVALLRVNGLHLPAFSLVPETLWHKVTGMFGYQDIDFDAYPNFSEKYLLQGSDEYGIRSLFNHWVISFYEGKHHVGTEGLGNALIYYRTHGLSHAGKWSELLADAQEIVSLFRR